MKRHLTRAWFLTSGGAVVLASCGHAHGSDALPPTTTSSSARGARAITVVPAAAEPIPSWVLTDPIVGEARRYDGATAPPKWMLAEGQTLSRAEYPQLASVLANNGGHSAGTTFTLPKSAVPEIIAVAGVIPANPRALATMRSAPRALVLRDAPPRMEPLPAAETKYPTWYPGTMATQQLLDEQRRAGALAVSEGLR